MIEISVNSKNGLRIYTAVFLLPAINNIEWERGIMFKNGLGEDTEFSSYHPIVNLIYFILTIGITMFSLSPVFLGVTFVLSWSYSLLLKGKKAVKLNLFFSLTTLIIMAVINTLFTHNGDTVLFYLNTNRITVEAFIYGISAAIMLVSVIIWFTCFNVIMTADKLIYTFGKVAPVLGLTLSMIFRFIPLLKSRFGEIRTGQACMGVTYKSTFIGKVRQFIKEISILISWSLEASIESGDSMEARGYGLKGRTSFNLFKFTRRDVILIIVMTVLGAVVITGLAFDKASVVFYPKYTLGGFDIFSGITLICYIALLILPMIIDLRGEMKWKRLSLEM